MNPRNIYKDILFGVATGDALGVPVEFETRETIRRKPVTNMTGYGTYNLPPGTWSDDSSLSFCLAEALTESFSLHRIAAAFIQWLYFNRWTPRGHVFDVGITTRNAISNLKTGTDPELAGGFYEDENGNGSLMRILPLLFYIKDKDIAERYELTRQVSSMTHGHIRSVIACFYYLEFARKLLAGTDTKAIYSELQTEISTFLNSIEINPEEVAVFKRLLQQDISLPPEKEISSSGYVLHTLEAAVWCLLTTNSYKDAVLKAVNLGADTDTTGAVTGGLAGLLYGFNSIPAHWTDQLARKEDIETLAEKCAGIYANS